MSTGPTPAHDPVTGEFMTLLSSSGEGLSNSAEEKKIKKKKKPDTVARALTDVLPPLDVRLTIEELFSGEDGSINIDKLRHHLKREGRLTEEAAMELVKQGTRLFTKEKTLLELKTPLSVVGDSELLVFPWNGFCFFAKRFVCVSVHGQYYDLTALLDRLDADTPALFLGDFVDRGYFGCEVTFLLLALKLRRPQHLFMLRGNHESRQVVVVVCFVIVLICVLIIVC
jgi:serine/threonine-protein phosphatase 2B catalytic subunit